MGSVVCTGVEPISYVVQNPGHVVTEIMRDPHRVFLAKGLMLLLGCRSVIDFRGLLGVGTIIDFPVAIGLKVNPGFANRSEKWPCTKAVFGVEQPLHDVFWFD